MLEVEVDQRYTALQVLEHPWVTVSTLLIELIVLLTFLLEIVSHENIYF